MANQSKISDFLLSQVLFSTKQKTKLLGLAVISTIFLLLKLRPQKMEAPIIEKDLFMKKSAGQVNKKFFNNLMKILKVVFPKFVCKETFTVLSLSLFLVLRTFLTIYITDINAKIVKSIVDVKFKQFFEYILKLILLAVPGSFMNSYLEYLRQKLSIQVRTKLINFFMNKLTINNNYYKIENVDVRIKNIDQIITQDVEKWSNTLTTLYNNVTKPILDIFLFSKKLSVLLGWQGPSIIILWYAFTVIILRIVSPSFGRLVAWEQKLEGEYRQAHFTIVSHSEEIAFYKGHDWENKRIFQKFFELIQHQTFIMYKRLYMGSFDSLLAKYGATMCGYSVVGIPVFSKSSSKYLQQNQGDQSQIAEDYIRNSSMLISLAKAIGRLVISYKDISELAGYTHIVTELMSTLNDLEKGNYQQNQIVNKKFQNGQVFEQSFLQIDDIPINTPKGDQLIKSFQILTSFIIQGPNGSGKSSFFRIISELWPQEKGVLKKPQKIFYIPQKCYLPLGTLRDQIIYPHRHQDMINNNITDYDLDQIMVDAHLDYIVQREGGYDTVNDWNDILSGGEKQRINLSRLFYHKPKIAILDDSTSAVSVDVEQKLFQHIKKLNIQIITVSHRQNLSEFHDFILNIDDKGNWEIKQIN